MSAWNQGSSALSFTIAVWEVLCYVLVRIVAFGHLRCDYVHIYMYLNGQVAIWEWETKLTYQSSILFQTAHFLQRWLV